MPDRLSLAGCHVSMMIKVLTMHMIQLMVDSANTMMIIAKSHFKGSSLESLGAIPSQNSLRKMLRASGG